MTNTEFKNIVGNNFFSVSFKKKDGTIRTYSPARVGVSKFKLTKGGNNPVEHKSNLVTVNLPNEGNSYRTLNLDSIVSFKCGDREITV